MNFNIHKNSGKQRSHLPIQWLLLIIATCFATVHTTTLSAQPNLTVSRDTINFGYKVITEPVGKSHLVTLKNTGNQNLSFTSPAFQITGDHATDFTITTAPATAFIAPSAERYMHLAFAPTSLGKKQANLLISTTDPDTPVTTVTLTGHAVPARATTAYGPFDGYGPGQSTIGTGGDYPSLYEATEAISATPLTGGDWDFVILNDLHEPNHCTIQHENNNGHTITFRSAPDTSPRVTFTTTVQSLQEAHLTIIEPTSNITFTGSGENVSTSPTLTFANQVGGSHSLIRFLYNCDYINIEHCRLEVNNQIFLIGSYGPTAILQFFPRRIPLDYPDTTSDYVTIKECEVVSYSPFHVTGIAFTDQVQSYGNDLLNYHGRNISVTDNYISTHGSGISTRNILSPQIRGNSVKLNRSILNGNYEQYGIATLLNTNSASGTARIDNNTITFDGPRAQWPLDGILIEYLSPDGTVLILSNIIAGITAASSPIFNQVGVRIKNQTRDTTIVIAHNSICFNYTQVFYHTQHSVIGVFAPPFAVGSVICTNNILNLGHIASTAIFLDQDRNFSSNYNNIITAPEGRVGFTYAEGDYTTLADWQTSTGHDLASISQNPFVPAGNGLGTWVGPADAENPDLHFTSFPGEMYLAPPLNESTHLTTVPTDIDGEPRNPIATMMGADEVVPEPSAVQSWTDYQFH
jgi:hypothetical protein